MLKSKTQVLSLAVFAALAILPMGSRADDGGSGGAYDFPTANYQEPRDEERMAENVSCAVATKAAWFGHQLEISDGEVSPVADAPRECNREIYATADEAKE